MNWIYDAIRSTIAHWGYLAVLAGLLGEDAGLPVPGETVLLFASFLSRKNTSLQLVWVVLVGIAACTAGDNLGFLFGRKVGPRLVRLLRRVLFLEEEDIAIVKDQLRRHGAATIYWARFIFGLRTVAGPVAGALGMEWKEFTLFNALGAATWVTVISVAGYVFAKEFNSLLSFLEKASWGVAAAFIITGYLLWRRKKKRFREQKRDSAKPRP